MNRTLLARGLTVALVSLSAAFVAHAQSRLQVDIPFPYTASKTAMPAGSYSVTSDLGTGIVILRSDGSKNSVILAGHRVEPTLSNHAPALGFNCYGEKCFLSRVWGGFSPRGLEFKKSPAEREQMASLTFKPKVLTLRASVR